MVSEKPAQHNGDVDLYALLKELRKSDPQEAKKLQKKLKKKRNKLNNKNKKDDDKIRKEILASVKNEADDFKDVEIEYVLPSIDDITKEDDTAENFVEIFEKFRIDENEENEDEDEENEEKKINFKEDQKDHEDDDDDDEQKLRISKKKLKQLSRMSLAQLKQIADRPDLVEIWDTTAADSRFLVFLKSCRNTICVPTHWNSKRKYMQAKRGIEKTPFKLPNYIEDTKISEIRQAILEKDAQKSAKQKQKEKVRPKMHRMDIDYQVLHDAFFKYATKPKLTKFGDLYYEGKENELKMKKYKPGVLSEALKEALGMAPNAPPPWLINMQRYGPPPRYTGLKIPGLNAPIPAGAEYGYHPGGWGKPPVDEYGNPLYGDFGYEKENVIIYDESLWGEILSEDEKEEEEEQQLPGDGEGIRTPVLNAGVDTPLSTADGIATETSGIRTGLRSTETLTSGIDTPESLDIRKRSLSLKTQKPYTILQPQPAPSNPTALFASNITYKMPNKNATIAGNVSTRSGILTPGGVITPSGSIGGVVTPYGGGLITPYGISGGALTPYGISGGAITPYGVNGGTITPYGVTGGGTITPYGAAGMVSVGMATPNIKTVAGDRSVDIGGLQTPAANPQQPLTVSLNPTDMEQEGVFTADVIRHQLKQHEEAAMRVKQAAKQIDVQEVKKRKGETAAETTTKKKKKEKFKF